MIKRTDIVQGTLAWLEARAGIPTASEFGNLVTDTFEVRKGEMPRSYVAAKLEEAWLGTFPDTSSWAMEQGNILEDEAIPWYELTSGFKVERVGFCTTDDGKIGCSPDGLIVGDHVGVEIKCPQPKQHIKTLLNGKIPAEHLPQIHGGMFVTGFKRWLFVSYHRNLPKFIATVEWDEEVEAALRTALDVFLFRFDEGWKKLCDLNGGPPRRRK